MATPDDLLGGVDGYRCREDQELIEAACGAGTYSTPTGSDLHETTPAPRFGRGMDPHIGHGKTDGIALPRRGALLGCTGPHDLPARLFLGYRDDASFERRAEGFCIRYPGPHGMETRLSVEGERAELEQRWEGAEGLLTQWPAAQGLRGMLHALPPGPPLEIWLLRLDEKLGELGNFRLLRDGCEGGAPMILCLPDGLPVTLRLVVDARRLPELTELYDRLAARPIPPLLAGRSRLVHTAVNFLQDERPDEALFQSEGWRLALGVGEPAGMPAYAPELQSAMHRGEETWAITLSRNYYLHECQTFLRDVLPICEALAEAGFVAPQRDDAYRPGRSGAGPGGVAACALVQPGIDLGAPTQLWSSDGRVRVTHPGSGAAEDAFDLCEATQEERDHAERSAEMARQIFAWWEEQVVRVLAPVGAWWVKQRSERKDAR